ncbi:hypothetical protein [Marinomonas aquiplantarum]|uniref:Uncharacterized protein n=1 Tax=Marinomonas aquiplantarum TaxID=491951 RepID=A0A366D216_9GAMM|nr:hypothetical protein [Marinomonas aquiplantarum]RBO83965.1 hypothetical protein DFP76_103239 [Marinomonas aquiplantarum]
MTDVTTWINVADNAVKIGLGALLGGGFGLFVAWMNNKSQVKKDLHDRRRAILEGVLESVDSSANAASLFWANLANTVYKRDNNQQILENEKEELDKLQNNFFAAFTLLNSSGAKLLLLGEEISEAKLSVLRTEFDALFRIGSISNSNCTKENLNNHKELISKARKDFYLELSKAYQRGA